MTQMNTDQAPNGRAWMMTGVGAATPEVGPPARRMPPVDGVAFAVLDRRPVRFNEAEAWEHHAGQWVRVNLAVIAHEANLLCDWAFMRPLPPLPAHAFGGRDV